MKKNNIPLTKAQQELVVTHLSIVHWVIHESILVNENVFGYGYDELFQEGCICLCQAAITYDVALARFSTYAKTVVRNGLYSYCRHLSFQQKRYTYFTEDEYGDPAVEGNPVPSKDMFEQQYSLLETIDLLESHAQRYDGIAKLGIKALELKIQGMSVTEIARLYNVPTTHVGAWISRSTEKLRNDPVFLNEIA